MGSKKGSVPAATLDKSILLDLLKDPEVSEKLKELIIQIVNALQGETPTTPAKKAWWKSSLNVLLAVVPFVLKFFGRKK